MIARLAGPGGARSVVAESVLVKPQRLIAPHLSFVRVGAEPACHRRREVEKVELPPTSAARST